MKLSEKISAGLNHQINRLLAPENLLDELSEIYDAIEKCSIQNYDEAVLTLSARYSEFAKIVKELTAHERFTSDSFNAADNNIFANLPALDEGIIAEFSNMHKRWTANKDHVREEPNSGLKLERWGPLDLCSYWESHVPKEVSDELLYLGIWNGKNLLQFFNYLEKNKGSKISKLFEDFLRVILLELNGQIYSS